VNPTIADRLAQVRRCFSGARIDTLMVFGAENRRYLSGFTAEDTACDESSGVLFITSSQCLLATDSRYELQAKAEADRYRIYCYREGLAKSLPEILLSLGSSRIGFESRRISFHQHRQLSAQIRSSNLPVTLVEIEDMVEDLRVVKAESEILAIRKALMLAESVFTGYVSELKPGVTERQAAWAIEKRIREAGAESVSFPVIVASGPNSALPHAVPGDRPIREGEPILFDWGARLDGYCSDISRTVCIGKPDERFRLIFKTVYDAQQKAIRAIHPGIGTRHIDQIARSHIDAMGYPGKFGHGLGHGTGLAIHEYPRLSPFYDKPLQPGMVCTVEPGIYLPDWGGIRLENMIVVRRDGAEVLNTLPIRLLWDETV